MKATLFLVVFCISSVAFRAQSQASQLGDLSDDIKKIQSMLDRVHKQSPDSQTKLQSLLTRLEEINKQLKADEQVRFLDPGPFGRPSTETIDLPSSLFNRPDGNYVVKG